MATETTYVCDGCGETAAAVEETMETRQWGAPGIPDGWLVISAARWGAVDADPRRETAIDGGIFHSIACAVQAIEEIAAG